MNMGLIDRLKKEYRASRYNRELENDPAVVRSRLDAERLQVRKQKETLLSQRQLEMDKKELRDLKNSTGVRGRIREGLGAVRNHLDNVKTKRAKIRLRDPLANAGRSPGAFEIQGAGASIKGERLRGMHSGSTSKSLIMQGPGSNSGGGVMGGNKPSRKKMKQRQIIIKL